MECVINAKFLGQQIKGTQQVGIGLSKYLKAKIPGVQFVTTSRIIHTELAENLLAFPIGNRNDIFWEQVDLFRFLNSKNNPLLVDFGNTAPCFYKNKISTILDISPVLHPEWFSYKSGMYLRLITNAYIKKSKKIIAISEYTKGTIIDRYNIDSSSVEIIYPACPEIFDLGNQKYVQEIDNNICDYILAVSSMDPRKNFIGLIEAFKRANIKNLKLLIVGSQSKVFANQDFKNAISNNESIIFTGYITDEKLISLYRGALFFVYPSFFEGFGIPPLEAMICECPTIVSNTTSLPEVCGDASLYIDPYKNDSLVDGIIELYNNEELRKQLKSKGIVRAKAFSWEKSAEKLAKIVNSIRSA
jgi:glycosyltransferase involved in cell wall biosynthesis